MVDNGKVKLIFVTGGVVSSLGKGLTAASLGTLLEAQGLNIVIQKFDPYLNVDPGTMSPCQHGEVYVLDDGAETDLDLGHYERFTNVKLSKKNSVSSGQIYEKILQRERNGEYLGNTVQVIPHVTDEIKSRILAGANDDTDVIITEIGGVVGDIEGLPFIEALRQLSIEFGRKNVLFIHVTLLPFLKASSELKTKPSQQTVAKLREIGIQADVLVCRTEVPIDEDIKKKLSLFCNVPTSCVIEELDVKNSIYELPLMLHSQSLDKIVLNHFGLKFEKISMSVWDGIIQNICNPTCSINVGLVGKYTDVKDAYKSVCEALFHAGIAHKCKINIIAIDAEELESSSSNLSEVFAKVDAILVPGGFGSRGIEGKIKAITYARTNDIPFLGICLGMQLAAIEFARNVLNLTGAHSTEIDSNTNYPIISLLSSQYDVSKKGATMRLGANKCTILPNTKIYEAYQSTTISERHRHRYEFNDDFKQQFEKNGAKIVGVHQDTGITEAIELSNHSWFVGVQFHPEFQSKPNKPHALFSAFVKASISKKSK